MWDLRKGEVSQTLSGHTDTITGLSLSPDGNHLLSNSMVSGPCLWLDAGGVTVLPLAIVLASFWDEQITGTSSWVAAPLP